MKKEVWIKLVKRIGNWIVNICFYSCVAFVAWMVLQVFCLTSFKIPSNSMEPALLSGDKILVDKWTGGARLFNIFASLRGEEVDIYRLPGFGSFQRDDVLVFNFPYQDGSDSIGFDIMKYYVKRCIALPGDTLEIRKGYYHIKGITDSVGECAGATSDCTCQKGRFTWDRDGCFSVGRTSGMDHSGIRTSSGTSQRAGGENRYIVLFALRKTDPLGAEEETAAKRRGGMSG